MAKFVLNDEKVTNSYGFSVRNEGIDLSRFKNNPIMLNDHWNSNSSVLGRWKNLNVDGSKLTAEDEFDEECDDAKKVKGKVDRGFIKSCSMGIRFNRDNMKAKPDGTYELIKCELMEASIVAIPSNANALRLYAESGELMSENEVKLSLQNLKPENLEMEKFQLSAAALIALGLANADDANAVSTAIANLKEKFDKEATAHTALKATFEKQSKDQAELAVAGWMEEGRLTADMKEDFVKMHMDNPALATKVANGMAATKKLGGQVNNPAAGGAEVKTDEDFDKLSTQEQLAWKAANPDQYKKIFS